MIKVVSAYRWIFSLVVSRPFGYDQVSICSFWLDRFVAPFRSLGYDSLVSALQSGTRLGSLDTRGITLSPHQISIRRSFGGFLNAELSSNGFSDGYDDDILAEWYSIWVVLAGRSSSLSLPSRVSPGADGRWYIDMRWTSRIEFALRCSLTGEESVLAFSSLLTMLT